MKSIFKYLLIFSVALIGSASIAYYSIRLFTQSAEEIILPELSGKNIIYVLETLTNMGLNAKLYGTQYHESVPKYAVISQDPPAGITIKRGRDVIIYISKGNKQNIMPDLRQTPLKQALILLEKNEFKKGAVTFTYSSKTQKDSVITHYPDPFSTAQKETVCDLLVSRGPRPLAMVMPDITGFKLDMAAAMLKKNNLEVSKIISDVDRTQDNGQVLSVVPRAGSHVTGRMPITLTVNDSVKNRQMLPDQLNNMIFLTHSIGPGLLKRHVRVETDMFGPILNLYNEYMTQGKDINILVPSGIKTFINIFIDHHLVKTITIDPWEKDTITGDILWESSPLQFYHPISPDLVKN